MAARASETVTLLAMFGQCSGGASQAVDVHACLGEVADFVARTRPDVEVNARALGATEHIVQVGRATGQKGGEEEGRGEVGWREGRGIRG